MKKIFTLTALSFLVALLLSTVMNAVAAGTSWIFDSQKSIDQWSISGASSEFQNGVMHFSPTTWDPIMLYTLSANEQVSCEDYKYVAFNMNAITDATAGGLFFGTSINPGPTGPEFSEYKLVASGEWHDYIIDMSSYPHGKWKGKLNKLRLDPQNTNEFTPAEIYIGRIGVFQTIDEAKAFLAAQVFPEITINNNPSWVFNGGGDAEGWNTQNLDFYDQFDVAQYIATGADVQLANNLNALYNDKKKKFNGDEFRYFALRYNATLLNQTSAHNSALFFSTDKTKSISDASSSVFPITCDSQYHNYVVDMKSFSHNLWNGQITALRLDLLNPANVGDSFIISRFGFFKTQAEADAFLSESFMPYSADQPNFAKTTEFSTDSQKVIIPSNTLNFGYNINNYILSSTKPTGSGDSAVVLYKGSDNKEEIIALSDVNAFGYVRYLARKNGQYSVKYNSKNFNDISEHWGSDYIKYLSAREVFGGTSPEEFSPDMPMTRGMFITVLGRMHGLDTTPYDTNTGYKDVNPAEYYAPYIAWSKANNILPGTIENTFLPEKEIVRGDMALAINNYLKYYKYNILNLKKSESFNDIDACNAEIKDAINHIQRIGIINGNGNGNFIPDGLLTRAETATVITRVIKAVLGTNYVNNFDRNKFLIGAFGYADNLYNEESVTDLVNMDVDYLISSAANKKLLTLLEKHNMPVIVNNRFPTWWGGDGDNAGNFSTVLTPNKIKGFTEKALNSEIIVGDYIVDEPSSKDFVAINDVYQEYLRIYKNKLLPIVNLYPNYGSTHPENNPNAISQLGNVTYAEHINQYVREMKLDYISFDNYPYQSEGAFAKYLQNLDEVAAACRENNLDMWVIIQTGSWNTKAILKQFQIEWQMYLCMAYGSTGIMHACYTPNWWDQKTSCVDVLGNKNITYTYAKNANEEIHRFSDVYMSYNYLGTYGVSQSKNTISTITAQLNAQNKRNLKRNGFTGIDGITVQGDAAVTVGCFESKHDASQKALMLVNCRDPYTETASVNASVNIGVGKSAIAYINGNPEVAYADASGNISLIIAGGEGVFLVIK